MARRRRSSTSIIRVPAAAPRMAAPIINVRAPSSGTRKRTRRRSSGGSGAASGRKRMLNGALGGAGYGFVEKVFPNLPTVPVLGKAGTVALACYFLKPKGILADIGFAAAVLAGYQLGKEGRISGDDYDDVVPQVRGVAAQV